MKQFFKQFLFFIVSLSLSSFFQLTLIKPLLTSEHLIFPYAIHPFDICIVYPTTWFYLKKAYIALMIYTHANIWIHLIKTINKQSHRINISKINLFSYKRKNTNCENNSLNLFIGLDEKNTPVFISENGLYQNILITGTIGSGKTSSAMYPFTFQLMNYCKNDNNKKLGMLILDVKGNYVQQIQKYARQTNRENDLLILNLSGNVKYNPLDKPHLKANIVANRLRTILSLFSKNNSESYWLDKAEQALCEAIKLCRLYNNGYVTFTELHNLLFSENYYKSKIDLLRNSFIKHPFSNEKSFNLIGCIDFFQNEYFSLDNRTLNILKSEISLITGTFVSDYHISNVFCPSQNEINFNGFEEVISQGKIVILQMNIAEYKNLSKLIAAYLKLDFQNEILSQLATNHSIRQTAFICDEYHEYVTDTDSDFLSICREAKCINILSTQSYTSLLNTLVNESATKVILQNIINKIWFRTDDIFTIEQAQKQIGKIEHVKQSISISENSKQTNYNAILNKLISHDSSISESYNQYTQFDYRYDTNYFSQSLKTFEALCFLSNGYSIHEPQKVSLIPYFKTNSILNSIHKEEL